MSLRSPRRTRPGLAQLEDGPRLFAVAALAWWATFALGCIVILVLGR